MRKILFLIFAFCVFGRSIFCSQYFNRENGLKKIISKEEREKREKRDLIEKICLEKKITNKSIKAIIFNFLLNQSPSIDIEGFCRESIKKEAYRGQRLSFTEKSSDLVKYIKSIENIIKYSNSENKYYNNEKKDSNKNPFGIYCDGKWISFGNNPEENKE